MRNDLQPMPPGQSSLSADGTDRQRARTVGRLALPRETLGRTEVGKAAGLDAQPFAFAQRGGLKTQAPEGRVENLAGHLLAGIKPPVQTAGNARAASGSSK